MFNGFLSTQLDIWLVAFEVCGLHADSGLYIANSIKVVFPKEKSVNYERTRVDGLLLIFTYEVGILLGKHIEST